jgi:hypothetical protein
MATQVPSSRTSPKRTPVTEVFCFLAALLAACGGSSGDPERDDAGSLSGNLDAAPDNVVVIAAQDGSARDAGTSASDGGLDAQVDAAVVDAGRRGR